MKRAIALAAMVLSVLAGPACAADALLPAKLSFDDFSMTPTVGTLGAGLEAGYRWNDHWGARVGINGLSSNFTYHDKHTDLLNRMTLLSAGLTADYYPYAGDFRVSAGLRLSANKIDGKLRNLEKHGKNYSILIDDPMIDFSVRQNVIQPYLGIGYSVKLQDRVSLNFDLGALYAGAPELRVHADPRQTNFTPHQIENETERQRDRIAPFQVIPVAQIGLTIKF